MLEGKKTATKPPVRKAPAALGETVKENEVNRRSFFSWLSLGWIGFVAATGGFFTMMLRFFFPNVLFEPVQTFRAGYPCLLYTSPSPRDRQKSRMPSSA